LDNKIVYVIFAITLVLVSSIASANTLTIESVNPIGATATEIEEIDDITIKRVKWTKSGGDYNKVRMTIENNDSVRHKYEVCIIYKLDFSISDDAGTTADCNTSANVGENGGTRTVVVTMTNPLPDHQRTKISIEEVS